MLGRRNICNVFKGNRLFQNLIGMLGSKIKDKIKDKIKEFQNLIGMLGRNFVRLFFYPYIASFKTL